MTRNLRFAFTAVKVAAWDDHGHFILPVVGCVVKSIFQYLSAGTVTTLIYTGESTSAGDVVAFLQSNASYSSVPSIHAVIPSTSFTIRRVGTQAATYAVSITIEVPD